MIGSCISLGTEAALVAYLEDPMAFLSKSPGVVGNALVMDAEYVSACVQAMKIFKAVVDCPCLQVAGNSAPRHEQCHLLSVSICRQSMN
jgi:hypothetical protein